MSKEGKPAGDTHLEVTLHTADGTLPGGDDSWTGTTLGKYRIVRRLGMGGMGVVYEAIDPVLQRGVAIKVLRDGIASQPKSVRVFMREARAAARLNHSHVVHVYEADQEKGMIYLVMELMENGSAHDRIHKWGPFDWVEATQVMLDACRGLAAVHAVGLIHRDVKPSNIMRAHDGTVKITDFGLALASTTTPDDRTPPSNVVGTPLYMSPEQCRGEKLDVRSDIYAIGATYYTLLTGKAPFEGKAGVEIMHGHCNVPVPDPRAIAPNVPQACFDFLRRTMGKKQDDRPENVEALIDELEHILTLATRREISKLDWTLPDPMTSAETTVLTRVQPTHPESKTRQWFVLVCLLLIAITFLLARHFRQMPPQNPNDKQAPSPEKDIGNKDGGKKSLEAGGAVTSLSFDPNDSSCVSWGTVNGREAVIYHVTGTRPFEKINHLEPPVTHVAYSLDGQYWGRLCAGRLVLREARKFGDVTDKAIPGTANNVVAFAFHPQKPLIALALSDLSRRSFEIALYWLDGKKIETPHKGEVGDLKSLTFSRDGSVLAAGCDNGHMHMFKIEFVPPKDKMPEQIKVAQPTQTKVGNSPLTFVFPLEGSEFAIVSGKSVYSADLGTGVVKREPIYTDTSNISAASVSSNGSVLIVSSGHNVIAVGISGGGQREFLEAVDGEVSALAASMTGTVIAVGTHEGKVHILRVK